MLGFRSLPHRWTNLILSLNMTLESKPNFGKKNVTQAAPASQPPPQGKINIGTMDVSDSDSEEEGQVSQVAFARVHRACLQFCKLKWSGFLCWRLFYLWQCNPGPKEEKVQCW